MRTCGTMLRVVDHLVMVTLVTVMAATAMAVFWAGDKRRFN